MLALTLLLITKEERELLLPFLLVVVLQLMFHYVGVDQPGHKVMLEQHKVKSWERGSMTDHYHLLLLMLMGLSHHDALLKLWAWNAKVSLAIIYSLEKQW